jgi:hypothetical protein
MEGNPFSKMAHLMKESSGGGLSSYLGKVSGISPLSVSVAGLLMSKDELAINSSLINADNEPALNIGDTVFLLTADNQLFHILCKVVRL